MTRDSLPAFSSAYPLRDPAIRARTARSETVLVDSSGRELFALNATAYAVWDCCDGTATVQDISTHLAHRYDARPAEIERDVRAILDDFHARGLLRFDRPSSLAGPVTHSVSFYDHHVEIYIDAPRLASSFEYCTDALLGEAHGTSVGRIEAYDHEDGFLVRDERGREEVFDRRSTTLTWMKRHFVTSLMAVRRDLLWLHAGAVAKEGRAVLCAGHRGCGKSTIVTGLYEQGWSYFTDDVLPYDPATGTAIPFPLTPVFRKGGGPLVDAENLDLLKKTHLRLDDDRIARTPAPVHLLVFPAFQPESPRAPVSRGPKAAVKKLAKHCFNLHAYAGDPMSALSRLAEQARAFDVEHNADHPPLSRLPSLLPH